LGKNVGGMGKFKEKYKKQKKKLQNIEITN
jgi:hypothetical protein